MKKQARVTPLPAFQAEAFEFSGLVIPVVIAVKTFIGFSKNTCSVTVIAVFITVFTQVLIAYATTLWAFLLGTILGFAFWTVHIILLFGYELSFVDVLIILFNDK